MEQFQILKNFYREHTIVSEAEFEYIKSKHKYLKLKRGEVFHHMGEVCNNIGIVNSGVMRYYYSYKSKEHTSQFFFQGDLVADYISYHKQEEGKLTIDAISETEIVYISRTDLESLYEELPHVMYRCGKNFLEKIFINFAERVSSLLLDTPEKRYLNLFHNKPEIIQNVPQYMIASYLGVTPEALSRIRGRLARENR